MTSQDRDIDGALEQVRGDTSPKVGDWEPSDEGCGFWAVLGALVLAAAIWGALQGAVP